MPLCTEPQQSFEEGEFDVLIDHESAVVETVTMDGTRTATAVYSTVPNYRGLLTTAVHVGRPSTGPIGEGSDDQTRVRVGGNVLPVGHEIVDPLADRTLP